MAPLLIPKKLKSTTLIKHIYHAITHSDKVRERYENVHSKHPSLVPTEVPVHTHTGTFTEIRYINPEAHEPHPKVHAVNATGDIASGPIKYKGWKAHASGWFNSLANRATNPSFLENAPFNHEGFATEYYLEKLKREAITRSQYYGDLDKYPKRFDPKPPLREIIDIRNPEKYTAITCTSLHGMTKSNLYQLAKGNKLQFDENGNVLKDEQGVPLPGEKLDTPDYESARKLVELCLFRYGYRTEHGRSAKLDTQKRALEDNELYQSYVAKGAKAMISQIKERAVKSGWDPGKIDKNGYAENPLHLAAITSKTSFNMIPTALANTLEMYSKDKDTTGKEGFLFAADDSIYKTNTAKRTSSNKQFRFFQQATFGGSVTPNTHYVILDDVMTTGSTFLNVAGHIAAKGGIVAGFASLANSAHGPHMISTENTYANTRKKDATSSLRSLTESQKAYDEVKSKYDTAVKENNIQDQEKYKAMLDTEDENKKLAQRTLNVKPNVKSKCYEHLMTNILKTPGNDALEKVLKARTGLSYLTMTNRELQTLHIMLGYINDRGDDFKRNSGHILSEIITKLDFNKIDRTLKAESVVKNLVEQYTLPKKFELLSNGSQYYGHEIEKRINQFHGLQKRKETVQRKKEFEARNPFTQRERK